jgi:ABC-type anion transport system duplicated permease subunit
MFPLLGAWHALLTRLSLIPQWYILLNVIAGAFAIPTDLNEYCSVFRLEGIERWTT